MRYLSTLFVVLLLGCSLVTAPTEGAVAFDPDTVQVFGEPHGFRAVWDSVQACVGKRGDFERITFMVYPDREIYFILSNGNKAAGYADWRHHTIYFATNWIHQAFYIKHEMVHELLQRDNHPIIPFKFPCHVSKEEQE